MAENVEEDVEKHLHEVGTEDLEFGDDVSDEKCAKLVLEVSELATKVAEYREKVPKEVAALLERKLSAFRKPFGLSFPVVESAAADAPAQEEDTYELAAERVRYYKRLEVVIASLPTLMQGFKDTMSRLDNLIQMANKHRIHNSYSSSVVTEEKIDHLKGEMGKSGASSSERFVNLSSTLRSA